MKICWDNLENLRYNPKTGKWYLNRNEIIFKEACLKCKEPFLIQKKINGNFCCRKCFKDVQKAGYTTYKTHGMTKTTTYKSWQQMKSRCYNPNHHAYHRYGGRGIFVCRRWRNSFENFLEDMGERPKGTSIDRIDNNGPYGPWNCKWVTDKEQQRNRNINKLDYDKVKRIKELLEENNMLQKDIALIFDVNPSQISDIKREKIWK